MTDIQDLCNKLEKARIQGNFDDLAETLTLHANLLVEAGQYTQACSELDEAANIHKQYGRTYDEGRCTHLAATLCRFYGNLDEAKKRALYAVQIAEPASPIIVSATTELGEIALAQHNGSDAIVAYSQALAHGEAVGLVDTARASLLRRLAIALAMKNRYQEAADNLAEAYKLLLRAGDDSTALQTLIEQITALQQGNNLIEAEKVRFYATQVAQEANNKGVLAELCLLQASQALELKDINTAMLAAQTARTYALESVVPVSYISAVITIAELADTQGDRLSAYETLAVGWVTLADLLGRDTAKATFEPKLLELRNRWGVVMFNNIKQTYEDRRRAKRDLT